MAANLIAENLFAQVDQEGRRYKLIYIIIDVRIIDQYAKDEDLFDISSNGTKRRKAATKGWEVCKQLKDGSTTWNTAKDVKD